MNRRKPKTIKVTVYSCRNLKPKKGDGDPLAWVVFGFGKDKCCTSQIRDRNAKWNEESTFTIVDPKIPLKMNINDKDDHLGQLVIPVSEIPSDEHFLKWVPLSPHKKNPNPAGELCIDCWVEEYYDDLMETASEKQTKPMKYLNKTLGRLTSRSGEAASKSPKGSPENDGNRFSTGVTSMRGSVSVQDISYRPKKNLFDFNRKMKDSSKPSLPNNNSLLAPEAYTNGGNISRASSSLTLNTPTILERDNLRRASVGEMTGLSTIKEQNYPPKVLNIVPLTGPTTGGTLIQITGRYLGASLEDITRLMVAGCNCLSTVEYYSPNKIMCTTSQSEGKGPISLSTKTGGMSSSKMMFEFVETSAEDELNRGEEIANGRDSGFSSGGSDADMEKDELIEALRNDIDQLKTDNRELREYVDKLVVYLMDKYPDALDTSKMYYR